MRVALSWDTASDDDKREAARMGLAEIRGHLRQLEVDMPIVVALVEAGVQRAEALPLLALLIRQVCDAIEAWSQQYPEFSRYWDDLGNRAAAILRTYTGLLPPDE